ncbi:hypothetical protein [Allokutzneria sp. NRRL B-24872]|uniref:hypothetical protein n=1 Tax=Allokutzneria sp. NRRL B-24872 TaxID=1137961 RepID=UPI000A371623|nr:hypothetical protein [Allokutzneria sp. NRRL B-24872]
MTARITGTTDGQLCQRPPSEPVPVPSSAAPWSAIMDNACQKAAEAHAECQRRLADSHEAFLRMADEAVDAASTGALGPRLHVFSGADRAEVLEALDARREADTGPARLVLVAEGEHAAPWDEARRWLVDGGELPAGARYRDEPVGGEIGFVYTNGSASYGGMGHELVRAVPSLAAEPLGEGAGVLARIWSAAWLCTVHTRLSRGLLGLRPSAGIGYSSGETAALLALGAWPDIEDLCRDTWESGLFTADLERVVRAAWERDGVPGEQWVSYLVNASAERLMAELADETAVHLLSVNAPDVCLIGGEAQACADVVARLGVESALSDYDLAAHAPELAEVRDRWHELHLRRTVEVPGVRFYSGASRRSYPLTDETAANAVTAQGTGMIDFAGTVEQAWYDGVRVFVEHGPRGLCTEWVKRVLGDRDHVAVAFDAESGGLRQLCLAVAELVAAGVPVSTAQLFEELRDSAPPIDEPALRGVVARQVQRATELHEEAMAQLRRSQQQFLRMRGEIVADMASLEPKQSLALPEAEGFLVRTEVHHDTWYLDAAGRVPAGLLIEAAGADEVLADWLGADLLDRDERAYRLLGCELTFHGSLPAAGDEPRYEIHVDRHIEHEGVWLFSFRYDCHVGDELRLSVRDGQAGFFTEAELAETDGVQWDAADTAPMADLPLDASILPCAPRNFSAAEVLAFAEGRPADCFGWEQTKSHVRTPRIEDGRMLFLREVAEFDPKGGPWGRGYLRATAPISPDDWFFDEDQSMPGTLMFQGCLQAMAFYLAALGCTVAKDGWRFELAEDVPCTARCRGQATPDNERITYEVFVQGFDAGSLTLHADVLATVDGVKAFHCQGVALRLVPDWPLSKLLGEGAGDQVPLAEVDGFRFDRASLLACAWGKPGDAFGPSFVESGASWIARLPGPPYHFMSRIVAVKGTQNSLVDGDVEPGSGVIAEYDVPDEAWYFDQNGTEFMPFAVLAEIALQPCAWLASYLGGALPAGTELVWRNLDSTGTATGEITPDTRTVRTHAEITSVSRSGDVVIESFSVRCLADGVPVFELSTVFGCFPASVFEDQQGLPVSREWLDASCEHAVEVSARGPMLSMLDRVTGYWPEAGSEGLGRIRAEKDVDAGEWFFKAHTFQDPVLPGSLAVEAVCQLLQVFMAERGLTRGVAHPRFEAIALGAETTWKHRGQVTPATRRVRVEAEIVEVVDDERGRQVIAQAWLWGDETCVFQAERIGVRVVPGDGPPAVVESELDPAVDTWMGDYRPTWTVPALPLMSIVDVLAQAAVDYSGLRVTEVRDVRLRRWLLTGEKLRSRTEVTETVDGLAVRLSIWQEAEADFEEVATAVVVVGAPCGQAPPRFADLHDSVPQLEPYESAVLFHGPAFQYVKSWKIGTTGASAVLDARRGGVPRGCLHQGLLDAAVQAVPHHDMAKWAPRIGSGQVGFACRVDALQLFADLPDFGEIEVEARFAGFEDEDGLVLATDVQLCFADRVLAAFRLNTVLFPLGRMASVSLAELRDFLGDSREANGITLSTVAGGITKLSVTDIAEADWLPGTVGRAWGLPEAGPATEQAEVVAVKDHIARAVGAHPSTVDVSADLRSASVASRLIYVHVTRARDKVLVRTVNAP